MVSLTSAPVPTGAVPVLLIQTVKLALQVSIKEPALTSLQGAGGISEDQEQTWGCEDAQEGPRKLGARRQPIV